MLHPDIKPGEFIRGYRARQVALNERSVRKCPTEELFARIGICLSEIVQMHTFVPYVRAIADGVHNVGKPLSLDQHYLRVSIFEAPVPHPRLCESCFREDVDFWGFAYFRREHQLPGVHFCLKHSEPLLLLTGPSAFDELPNLRTAMASSDGWQGEIGAPAIDRFAEVSVGLLDRQTLASRGVIVETIRARLAEKKMDEADLADAVDGAFTVDWLNALELRGAGNRAEQGFRGLMDGRSLRPRTRPHIVPLLMALAVLHETADEILNVFAGVYSTPERSEAESASTERALAAFQAGAGLELAAAHHQVSVRQLENALRKLLPTKTSLVAVR